MERAGRGGEKSGRKGQRDGGELPTQCKHGIKAEPKSMGPRPAFHALQRSAARHGHGGENRDIWRAGAASWAQRAGPLHNHLAGHKLWRDQAIAHAASVQGRQRRNKPTERVFVLRGRGVCASMSSRVTSFSDDSLCVGWTVVQSTAITCHVHI